MSEVNSWNVAAASNNATPPDGFPEGMNYSQVNDAARELMAAVKRWHEDNNGSLAGAGVANTYTVTLAATGYSAYFTGLTFRCSIPATNTGASTINVNSIGAKNIYGRNGAALSGGELVSGNVYTFRYDGTQFQVLDPTDANMAAATVKGRASGAGTGAPTDLTAAQLVTIIATADGAGSGLDADTLDGVQASGFAQLASANTFAGAIIFSSTVALNGAVTLAANITPDADSTRALGTTALRFLDVFTDEINDIAVTDFARLSQQNTFTAAQQVFGDDGTNGYLALTRGSASVPGYVAFYTPDDVRRAYFGFGSGTDLLLNTENSWGLDIRTPTGVAAKYNGIELGFRGVPQNDQSTNYTLVKSDAGKHIYCASGQTYTIPANSSVAYDVGTVLTFINRSSTSCSIAINTDTMYLAGVGTTGTRTLGGYGIATAVKIASTQWYISGPGLT